MILSILILAAIKLKTISRYVTRFLNILICRHDEQLKDQIIEADREPGLIRKAEKLAAWVWFTIRAYYENASSAFSLHLRKTALIGSGVLFEDTSALNLANQMKLSQVQTSYQKRSRKIYWHYII